MSERPMDRWEERVREAARAFPYPPTPDVAAGVARRLRAGEGVGRAALPRIVYAALAAMLFVAALLSVPPVRAAVRQALRIGAVRVVPAPPPAPTAPPATSAPAPVVGPATTRAPAATARSTPTPPPSVLDLLGETTLARARARFGRRILLPTYPPDLGKPDKVFVQDLGAPVVVLVWLDPERPGRVRLSLDQMGDTVFAEKLQPRVVRRVTVGGAPALWTERRHLLRFRRGGQADLERLVEGHTLIWTRGKLTYRLETDLPVEEAVRVAESLR